jgi:predicted DNA-binding ribbon-helix-helix protein
MERSSPSGDARPKSAIVRRYVTIGGRNSSVSLESAFWDALKEIEDIRGTTRATIVSTIESEAPTSQSVVGNSRVRAGPPLSVKNR